MIKRGLATLVFLSALFGVTSRADGDLIFPDSGVWSKPRIYQGTTLVPDITKMQPGNYTFKARVNNTTYPLPSIDTLTGGITGPEDYNWDWDEITVESSYTTRQRTETILSLGDYNLHFNLGSGQTINENFTIIPEPATLSLLGAGLAVATRKRR